MNDKNGMSGIRAAGLLGLVWVLGIAFWSMRASGQGGAGDRELFEKRIRPLLTDHCYGCHSGASTPARGGLRLDNRASCLQGGVRGPALVPGQPENSLLLKAVRQTDHGLKMPPNGRLSEEQIGFLAEWVRRGAPWPAERAPAVSGRPVAAAFDLRARASHWAWQPVRRPALPAVQHRSWARNPIDLFVLAKLEERGLTPAGRADRRTLLRRVTYDLTGLPPTPAEIHAFLADTSPNAYEKVVDRLLDSPHYGERWARHWLDLVRYAETDGHEWDIEKAGAWQYRDYLIRAFNADIPYREFVLEQIAGDLLPHPRLHPTERYNESVLGTGFYWLGSGKHSPVDLRDDEAERIDNQIDVLGKTFLGMGLGCARCHDHKFDAISTRDYYALYGFLKSTRLQEAPVGRPMTLAQEQGLEELRKEVQALARQQVSKSLKETGDHALPAGGAAMPEARNNPGAFLYPWAVLSEPEATQSPDAFGRARAEVVKRLHEQAARAEQEARAITWLDEFGVKGVYGRWSTTGEAFGAGPLIEATLRIEGDKEAGISAIFPAGTAYSAGLSDRLSGVLRSPTFTIQKPQILYHMAGRNARIRLIIHGYQRLRDPLYSVLNIDVNSPQMTWYTQDVRSWIGLRAYIEIVDSGAGFAAVDRIGFGEAGPPSVSPNPRVVKLLEDPAVTSANALVREYANLFREAAARLSAGPEQASGVADLYADPGFRALLTSSLIKDEKSRFAALLQRRETLEANLQSPQPALAAADGDGENERVHLRGNYRTPGVEAPRRFLEVCDRGAPLATAAGSGRLQLAERMVAPSDPLLARVIVNRLWQHHFGEGIVRTPDDFGVMGERPTHPELLDWLASIFTESTEGTVASARAAGQPGAHCSDLGASRHAVHNSRQAGRADSSPSPWACGWSLKKLHRLMVLSRTYQMDSRAVGRAESVDPQNKWVHRMPVRRLEAECIRDGILASSGRLDPALYGPPVMPYLNQFTPGRGAPGSGPLDGDGRRSLYLSVRRNFLIPMFLAFDYPVPVTTIGRRTVSNVPAQALTLLNNPFVVQQAQVWAKRVLAQPGTAEDRISDLYETAFGRLPRPDEREAALAFVASQGREYGGPEDPRTWSDLCHVLFNVKEFIFVH